jgi:hypothetical protein
MPSALVHSGSTGNGLKKSALHWQLQQMSDIAAHYLAPLFPSKYILVCGCYLREMSVVQCAVPCP